MELTLTPYPPSELPYTERRSKNNLEVTRLLLGHGADVHFRAPCSETPLRIATRKGRAQVVRLLLEHRAGKE